MLFTELILYNYCKKLGGRYMEYATYLKALNGRLEQNETTRELFRQIKGIEGEELIKQKLDQELKLNYVHDIELDINNKVQIDFLIVDDEKNYKFRN